MDTFDRPGTLMKATIYLLKASPRTLAQVADDTGLPYLWLSKLSAGVYSNPSVNRMQMLYEHLSGRQLVADIAC